MHNPLGLYIHIPFCASKCSYCNFCTGVFSAEKQDGYVQKLISEIKQWGGKLNRPIDTVYIGGGTPSVLGNKITDILNAVFENFDVTSDAEITTEANPEGNIEAFIKSAASVNVNRISFGVQTVNNEVLKILNRHHSKTDVQNAVNTARKYGIENITLDVMLGLPNDSISDTLDFLTSLNPTHISAYILKLEEKTLLYKQRNNYFFPNDDEVAAEYLNMCDYLKNKGYNHYEISNFSKEGFESRHNNKYWECKEYLGIGAAAHSFIDGKRFYYKENVNAFLQNPEIINDGTGGDVSEQIMLGLRLKKGVNFENISFSLENKIKMLEKAKYCVYNNGNLSLTDKGMLVSNSIITEISEEI